MPTFGLGEFLYELTVSDNEAQFNFWDREDATNTADVSIATKDFPEGITDPTARQVADLAFGQCSKVLNQKRDARLKKEAADAFSASQDLAAKNREAAADHFATTEDVVTAPALVLKDGTKVYNVPRDGSASSEPSSSSSSNSGSPTSGSNTDSSASSSSSK